MRVKLNSRGNEQKKRHVIKFRKRRFPNTKREVHLGTQINENLDRITKRYEKAVFNRVLCIIVRSRCVEEIQNSNRVIEFSIIYR